MDWETDMVIYKHKYKIKFYIFRILVYTLQQSANDGGTDIVVVVFDDDFCIIFCVYLWIIFVAKVCLLMLNDSAWVCVCVQKCVVCACFLYSFISWRCCNSNVACGSCSPLSRPYIYFFFRFVSVERSFIFIFVFRGQERG